MAKKKKHIIRRRVMRTMAAITMVMAVAVASIPVENFGTMRAAEEADALAAQDVFDMDKRYQEYGNAPDASADGVFVQQIDEAGNVKDLYKANDGTGIISSIADASANTITINETEYYNFVMFNSLDIGVNSIEVKFDEDTASQMAQDIAGLDLSVVTNSDFVKEKGKVFEQTYNADFSSTLQSLSSVSGSRYECALSDDKLKAMAKDTVDKFLADALKTRQEEILDRNTRLEPIVGKIKEANTNGTDLELDPGEVELWGKFVQNDIGSLTIGIPYEDNLSDAYKYIICQGYGFVPDDYLNSLGLVKGSYNDSPVYLPRLTAESLPTDKTYTQDGYIVGGKVTIAGIGKSAFKDAKLTSIEIPASVKKIDDYCFMGNDNLTKVVFGGGDQVKIGAYAFYNCPNLQTVAFSDETKYEIGEGAFALDKGHSDKSEFNFTFPKANDKVDSDYMLAGRKQLASVRFTENIGGTIPANTLRGCYGLRVAIFETADAGYDTSKKEDQLFADVVSPYFMVEGPAFKTGENQNQEAEPKKSSAKAIYANFEDNAGNSTWKSVPYKYTGEDGKSYIDIGYEDGKCVATIAVEENSTNATLVKYFATGLSRRIAATIPKNAGNYVITKIGSGCFDDKKNEKNEVKSNIYELTIEDYGSLTEIGEGAFRGCPNLEWVNIGNSVETIGANAFAQCPRLQNVKFSRNGSKLKYLDASAFDISDNGAPYLTFYGDIKSGYAPFDFAMGDRKTKQGAHVCYKTGAPENLTVLWNDETQAATLVDYPHYDEIDSINRNYINERHGNGYSIQMAFKAGNLADMTDADVAIVNAAFEINLPNEIESIDTASFFGNDPKYKKNAADNFYLQKNYVFDESKLNGSNPVYKTEDISNGRANIIAKYSENGDAGIAKGRSNATYDVYYAGDYGDKNVAIGGLFSGYFAEQGDKDYTSGNDNITSVSMPGVTELPDYAFDSCENLKTATFGPALEKIGQLPFRNAKGLDSVNLNGNNKYVFENKILYGQDGKGYKIIEMLESRTGFIGADEFRFLGAGTARSLGTGVTSIAPGAFSNNENISEIDLSGSEITEIPADCFKNSVNLKRIVLPPTVRRIEKDALKNVGEGIKIVIPTGDCVVAADAVDGEKTVTIIGEEKDDKGNLTELGKSVKNLRKVTLTARESSGGSNPETPLADETGTGATQSGSTPQSSTPQSSTPPSSTPPSSTPQSSTPQSSTPQSSTPRSSTPQSSTPQSSASSSSTPQSSTPPSSTQPGEKKYKLKVNGGIINGKSGEGEYAAGEKVDIEALAPDAPTKVFSNWSSSDANVVFKSATLSKTSFIMPASGSELVVTANYTTKVNSDDGDVSSRRSGTTTTVTIADAAQNAQAPPAITTTTTTTVTTTSNSSNTAAGTDDNNGNKIYIAKNGMTNQDVASVVVDGSTDNFITKISESAEAVAAAEQALISTYGSLDGIAYFPMDISLYDVSGQNKFTDTYGLNVTVTVPIPDALIQYGGNARVAACENGNLEQLATRFTTINGIACMSFVPPHFSPYVIYVDTNNLIAGQTLDETPKTGDPLHPKWFLAMGMACLSVVLFAASNGRIRRIA